MGKKMGFFLVRFGGFFGDILEWGFFRKNWGVLLWGLGFLVNPIQTPHFGHRFQTHKNFVAP